MRVVFNQLLTLNQKAGIGHYANQLFRALRAQAGDDRIDGFPTGWLRGVCRVVAQAQPYFDGGHHRPQRGGEDLPHLLAGLRRGAAQRLRQFTITTLAHRFRKIAAREGYDLYHEPNGIPLPNEVPTVITLHDLSVLIHPEWHPAHRVRHWERHLPEVLFRAVHVLTVSEFTRQEVIRHLGIPPARVTRVYNGIRPSLGPLPESVVGHTLRHLGLPRRYLLYVGTIEPRKNVLLLLKAYCSLPAHVRSQWPLVLVGKWGWNTADVAGYLHNVARHSGVIHFGYLADKHLGTLYNGARALVYPSFYEGFGFPPVEMLACGGAVLASTAGALVETVGSQAHLVHAEDLDGWREALLRVATDDDWWRSLRNGADLLTRRYTWERSAAETLQVYRSLAGRKDSNQPTIQDPAPGRLASA